MSACSSTDGSSLRLRKHSSVRNSPTPSTGACAADARGLAVGDVGQDLDRRAVGGRARARPGGQRRARAPGRRSTRGVGLVGVGLDLDRAGRAVDQDAGAGRRSSSRRRCRPRTGCASWRAMIAVWLVGPPRSVTSASDDRRVEARGVARREVLGDQHGRLLGRRARPGSGSPTRWATTRRSMSRRSVTRSAISPPMPVNIADELLDRGVHGGRAGRHRRAGACAPRCAGPCRGPGRRSRSAPRRRRRRPCRPCAGSPSATAVTASSYAASAASSSANAAVAEARRSRRARPRRGRRSAGP